MTSYLGRGYDDIPGKPFQWAWYQERNEIHNHLMNGKRGSMYVGHTFGSFMLQQRINAIQARIHKYKPTFKERHQAWLDRQPKTTTPPSFTNDELTHLIELFNGANDPTSRAIALKAAEMLQCRPS